MSDKNQPHTITARNASHQSPDVAVASAFYKAPFKALQYFQIAAQTGSFEQAAKQLHVTRGAVSQQIKSLEDWLGKALFSRHASTLTLTPAGEQLLPAVTQGLGIIQQGIAALSDQQTLVISSSHSFATFWLAPRSRQFHQQHPNIQWQMQPSNLVQAENQFQTDLAIRLTHPEQAALPDHWQSRELFENRLILVASPAFCNEHELSNNAGTTQWQTIPFLLDSSADISPAIQALCEHLCLPRASLLTALNTTDAVPLIYAALNNQGVALVAHCLIEPYLQSGELQQVTEFSYQSGQTFCVVAPSHHFQQQKVLHFLEWLFNTQ